MTADRIDASGIIEKQGRSAFTFALMVLISATAFLEGFDAQIQGYTAPAIIKVWHISQAGFSPVFVSFQFGLLVGAISFGNLGDLVGRRRVIVMNVALFGLFTVAGAWTGSVVALAATRFASAVFLGGAIPNAVALIVDYSPQGRRALRVGIMYVIYTIGGSLGGLLAAWLVPDLGWPSIYWLCGLLAMGYSVILYFRLPESVRFLVLRHRDPGQVAALMRKLDPGLAIGPDTEFFLARSVERKAWVGELFAERRGLMTAMLWGAYMANMIALQFNTAWMPTIFSSAGISYSKSVVATSLFQGGGTVGSILVGWMLDRRRGIARLALVSLAAIPVFLLIGQSAGHAAWLFVLAPCVGFCIIGGQTGLNAMAGFLYPTALRSTGVGWANGVGRIGAITGPLLGAALLSAHVSFPVMFAVAALPPLCAATLVLGINRFRPQSQEAV